MPPTVAALVVSLIGYLLFGDELFTSETPDIDSSDFLTIAFWVYLIIKGGLSLWHLVLVVETISEVQRINIVKTIASLICGFVIMLLPLIGFVFLLGLAI